MRHWGGVGREKISFVLDMVTEKMRRHLKREPTVKNTNI